MTAWRYFGLSSDTSKIFEIYRCPANGKRVEHQKLQDVYVVLLSDGSWRPNMKRWLLDEILKGWFHEKEEEISEQRMQELYSTWRAGTWPGRDFTKVK
jgi:hypothetical protein